MDMYHALYTHYLGMVQAILRPTPRIHYALVIFKEILMSLLRFCSIKAHELFNGLTSLSPVEKTENDCEDQAVHGLLDTSHIMEWGVVDEKRYASSLVLPDISEALSMNGYSCATESFHSVKSQGLSLHVDNDNTVPRWKPGSEIYYFIRGVESAKLEYQYMSAGMQNAALSWEAKNIGIVFKETRNKVEATFEVIHDSNLKSDTFAEAFFPGDRDRILRVGTRSFLPEHIGHISNILAHELGHIIGLRHDYWRYDGEPAFDLIPIPSSIMNHKNAHDLSLLVVTDQDGQHTRQFYQLPEGPFARYYCIKDHLPSTCTAKECQC